MPRMSGVEKKVNRLSGCIALSLLLACCLISLSGCPPQDGVRRVWLLNDGDCPITGMYICSDPREEAWGQNLLSTPLEIKEIELLPVGVSEEHVWWMWPHIDAHGLMAVGVLPGKCDIFVAISRSEEGDHNIRVLGAAQSPVSVRYLLE